MFAPIRPTPTKPMFIRMQCRMSNDEARRNVEVRMTEMWLSIVDSSFDPSSFFRHSSFVLRHLGLASNFMGKERIVSLLFPDARHWPVTGTNDRFVRQGQNFLEIGFNGGLGRKGPAPHPHGQ